eukprot:g5310.t1
MSRVALGNYLGKIASWKPRFVTDRSVEKLVETLRRLTELLIGGDQYSPELFREFIKQDGFEHLLKLLERSSNRRGRIAIQVLQTLAMLVQNIKNKDSLSYILNAEAIGIVTRMELDFNDEELLSYFVSFIKSVTMQLDESNVELFVEKTPDREEYSMPLFSRLVEMLYHEEVMIKTAVRTATLTILRIRNERIKECLTGNYYRNFYTDLAMNTKKKIQEMKVKLNGQYQLIRDSVCAEIENLVDDITNNVGYINDIFVYAPTEVRIQLADAVWDLLMDEDLKNLVFQAMNEQLSEDEVFQNTNKFDFIQLPEMERLESIMERWLPKGGVNFDIPIFTTFLSQSLSVLLENPADKSLNGVLKQTLNKAIDHLKESGITEYMLGCLMCSDASWSVHEEDKEQIKVGNEAII